MVEMINETRSSLLNMLKELVTYEFHFADFLYILGFLLFRDFCLNQVEEAKPLVEFYEEVRQ